MKIFLPLLVLALASCAQNLDSVDEALKLQKERIELTRIKARQEKAAKKLEAAARKAERDRILALIDKEEERREAEREYRARKLAELEFAVQNNREQIRRELQQLSEMAAQERAAQQEYNYRQQVLDAFRIINQPQPRSILNPYRTDCQKTWNGFQCSSY